MDAKYFINKHIYKTRHMPTNVFFQTAYTNNIKAEEVRG